MAALTALEGDNAGVTRKVLLTNARYWMQQERLAEVTDLMVRFPR
jgi:hypothetical protein